MARVGHEHRSRAVVHRAAIASGSVRRAEVIRIATWARAAGHPGLSHHLLEATRARGAREYVPGVVLDRALASVSTDDLIVLLGTASRGFVTPDAAVLRELARAAMAVREPQA